jgi:TolB-like protein
VWDTTLMLPTRADAVDQLERVLASDVFASTSRLTRFLRFVAERSLAGEGERLKEYVIGVEVFDRDSSYDPRIDSIVRVEAGRLRTKLEQYYHGPGRDDAIVIRLQKGSYAPTFERRARDAGGGPPATSAAPAVEPVATPPSAAPQAPEARPPRRRAQIAGLGIAALFVVAVTVAVLGPWPEPPPANAIAVLPFEPYGGVTDGDAIATRLTEGVTAELVRGGRFSVVPSRTAREEAAAGSARSVARRLRASWLLEARVLQDVAVLRVEARLVDPARNSKVWVQTFLGEAAELDDLARQIAAAASAAQLQGSESGR